MNRQTLLSEKIILLRSMFGAIEIYKNLFHLIWTEKGMAVIQKISIIHVFTETGHSILSTDVEEAFCFILSYVNCSRCKTISVFHIFPKWNPSRMHSHK